VPHDRIVGSSQNRHLTCSIYSSATRAICDLKFGRNMQGYLNVHVVSIQRIRISFEDLAKEKVCASVLRTANNSVMWH
jgi:hypothetical protein